MKKLQFKLPSKRAFIALFFIVWALFGAVNLAFPLMASAEDEGWYTADSMRKANNILAPEIYGATAAGSGDLSGFGEGTTKIGFDTLYGTTQRDTTYSGEVPNSDPGQWGEYPHLFGNWIDGRRRMWEEKPEFLLTGSTDDVNNDLSWKSGKTKDLHAYLLVSHSNVGVFDGFLKGLGGMSFAAASAFNAPFSWILKLFISFANFDVNAIASNSDLLDNLAKTISRLFTIDDNGNISPVLVVALAVFMIGLAGLIVRRIMGSGSAHELGKEIVMLILSFVLIGVSFIGGQGGYSRLIQSMGTLTTSLTEGIAGSEQDDIELFKYDTDNANADLNNYMGGLTAKGYIDTVIQSQFGYPVDELELWNDNNADVSQKNWGITTDDMKTIVRNIGGETRDQNLFAVSTYKDGTMSNSDAPNIGYWWYAVTSGIDPSNPFEVSSDGKIVTHKCDPKQGVFIMDLIAAIHAKTSADPSSIGYIKSEKIVDTFYSHDWKWAEMFAQVLITIMLVLAIFFLSIASFIFKIIFNIGFIIIPILPILLLIKKTKTRGMARKLLFSWVSSAIIFMLCLICMCAILFTSSALSSTGFVGILVDMALLGAAAFAAPRLVQALMSVPQKMGLEMAAPMNSAMHWGNEQLSKMNQKNPARIAAMDKMRQLDRKETHTNSADMTGFGGGESAYSNEANAAMLSNISGFDDDINKLSKREWGAVQNNTAKDFAEISEMKDSEALRQSGASEALVSAVQKKEEKEEAIGERIETIRQKRMAFYQRLQDSKLARVASYSRVGNHMLNSAMQLENFGREWQVRLDPRLHGSGLKRSDREVLNQARKSEEYDTGATVQRAKLKQRAVQEHMNKGRIHARQNEERQEKHAVMEKAAKRHVAKLEKRNKE